MDSNQATTYCYKRLPGNRPVCLDIYLPRPTPPNDGTPSGLRFPVVIYFHGGGLTVGNRKSWFPSWLYNRVLSLGYVFISADYQLIPPASGHDIVTDIQDLFSFITDTEFKVTDHTFKVHRDKIAVAGSSSGGLCAYLAAMHCSPQPAAVLSMYGMGGNFLSPHYLSPKDKVFFRGRELLDPSEFLEYLYPFKEKDTLPISDSPLDYYPQTYRIPGYPANPRMLLARLYLQLGVFLDYYTGMHDPGLSETLRAIINKKGYSSKDLEEAIPERHRYLFPQFKVDSRWPPSMLLHGTADSAVPVDESRLLQDLLEKAGVSAELVEFQDKEHSFDYEPDAEDTWGEKFNIVKDFLFKQLGSAT
ncbi:alpha/beta-hydrolase [Flammula alnicola]|nr:alpha/beta-hydrolase [Flammula alnicola]